MYCGNCGKKLNDNVSFCPYCGKRVDSGRDSKQQPMNMEKKMPERNPNNKNRKIVAALVAVCCVATVVLLIVVGLLLWKKNKNEPDGEGPISAPVRNTEEAISAVEELGKEVGYANALAELTERNSNEVEGDVYYRLQQNYQGIPVYGRTVVCASDENGKVMSVTGNALDVDETIDLVPSVSGDEIVESVRSYLKENMELSEQIEIPQPDQANLCIYNFAEDGETHLAYRLYIGSMEFVVDAHSSKVLYWKETAQTETGYAASDTERKDGFHVEVTDDNRYILRNSDLNLMVYDLDGESSNKFEKMQESNSIISADDVFGNDSDEADYEEAVRLYQNISEIKEKISSVCGFQNCLLLAFYKDGFEGGKNAKGGILGDIDGEPVGYISMGKVTGVDDIDVIGHEYAHVVSFMTVDWQKNSIENNAMNEGISDIFGEITEAWHNQSEEPNWIVMLPQINLKRNIMNPKDSGNASVVDDSSWWNEYWTGEEYHYSTVISHAAYLMWNGIDGTQEKKISLDDLARLWYRAMLMMPSDCDFSTCRQMVEWAAVSVDGITKEQRSCIGEAFDAVGITAEDFSSETVLNCDRNIRPDSVLNVYDKQGNLYADYMLNISGTVAEHELAYNPDIRLDMGHRYERRIEMHKAEPCQLNLPDGTYTFVVSDRNHSEEEYTFTVSVSDEGTDDSIELHTNFISVDVKDYLENSADLVQLLDMQPTDYWQFQEGKSYMKDLFYLEWVNDTFSMKNEGAKNVKLYGISIGDSWDQVEKTMTEAGWTKYYEGDNGCTYIAIINDRDYMLEITKNETGQVIYWYLNNWPEGEDIGNAFQKLCGGNEEWKSAYLSYIEEHGKVPGFLTDTYQEIYTLVNINNDNIPELYIDFGTTAAGSVICSYYEDHIITQDMWSGGFFYCEGQNLFREAGGHMDTYYDKIYCIRNGAFTLLGQGDYGAYDNSNVQMDEEGNPIYNYYWNGESVSSEAEYHQRMSEIYDTTQETGPFIGADYDFDRGRYVGNGLCSYEEIIEEIQKVG